MTEQIIDRGRVVELEGSYARVNIEAGDACKACGARILCAPGGGKKQDLLADNRAGAEIGDRVAVEEGGNLLLKLSVLQYGIPLAGFVGGLLITYLVPAWREFELILFSGAAAGLAAGGGVSWYIISRMARQTKDYFIVTQVLN